MKSNFEKDPRRQPEKRSDDSADLLGAAPWCSGFIVRTLTEIKTRMNRTIQRQINAS